MFNFHIGHLRFRSGIVGGQDRHREFTKTPAVERLRVLRIARGSLTPALRGRERAIAKTFPDIDLEVITTTRWKENGVDTTWMPDDLFPVYPINGVVRQHIQLFFYDPFPIVAALKRHRPHIIDIDHEPYSIPCAEIVTIRDLISPDTPIVMQTAQNILKRYPPPFSSLERRALRAVAGAYACNLEAMDVLTIKGYSGVVRLVPFGVDIDRFPFVMRPERNTPVIGYVGRLIEGKGLEILADALAGLEHETWRCVIVGDGPERESIAGDFNKAGLRDRVEFTGPLLYESVPQAMAGMDILAIPTVTTKTICEQFGRVIVEAMASGLPVIGSTCGAIPQVIGDAGIIVPEKDPIELAAAIKQLLHDKQKRHQLALAGRKHVEENYTWTAAAKKIVDLYQEVTGRYVVMGSS